MNDHDPQFLLDLYNELNDRLRGTGYDVYFDVTDVTKHEDEFDYTWEVVEWVTIPDDFRKYVIVQHRRKNYLDLFVCNTFIHSGENFTYNQVLGLIVI